MRRVSDEAFTLEQKVSNECFFESVDVDVNPGTFCIMDGPLNSWFWVLDIEIGSTCHITHGSSLITV